MPNQTTHDHDHNTYAMAIVEAITAHLRAVERTGRAPVRPISIQVPGGTWTLTRGDIAPRWCVTRIEHGEELKVLRFAEAIDPVAAVMRAFNELRPIELWPADADDVPIDLWPTDVPRGTSAVEAVIVHA